MTRASLLLAVLSAGASLAGCASHPQDFNQAPVLTPVGAGMVPNVVPHEFPGTAGPATAFNSLYHDGESLYRDPRAMKAGDLLTVLIQMDDKASVGNNTDRSLDSKVSNAYSVPGIGIIPPLSGAFTSDSKSEANGIGTIDRSEKIKVSVGAVVTQVLPDGNLLVSGSQELRINFEIRQVYVAGIVRPRDISKDNTVPYDKIAEARISYGGRGRLSEVQQPGWGQQLYDSFKPF